MTATLASSASLRTGVVKTFRCATQRTVFTLHKEISSISSFSCAFGTTYGLHLRMFPTLTLVLLVQFGLPFAAALWRELARSQARSGWLRLSFGVASAVFLVIPASVYMFVTGSSPHGESVDWYLMLCLFSFGTVPLGVAAIVYFAISTFIEPLLSFVCRKPVVRKTGQLSAPPIT